MRARAQAIRVAAAAAEEALSVLRDERDEQDLDGEAWHEATRAIAQVVLRIRRGVLRAACRQFGADYRESVAMAGWGRGDVRDELQAYAAGRFTRAEQ